jgi:hypothetical protein
MLRKSCLSSMMDPQEDITVGILLHTKSSEKDTTGLPYLKMLMHMLGNSKQCQTSTRERKESFFPLTTYHHRTPLPAVGVGCYREINPNSSQLHKYILTTTDYFTRWSEAIPLKTINENQVICSLNHTSLPGLEFQTF